MSMESASDYDGADGVVKIQLLVAAQSQDLLRQSIGGKRPSGDDHDRAVFVDARNFFALHNLDPAASAFDGCKVTGFGKLFAVDGQRVSGGNGSLSARFPSAASQHGAFPLSAARGAVFSLSDFSEFEQTNSAKFVV